MSTRYKQVDMGNLDDHAAVTPLPLFGRWCVLTLCVRCIGTALLFEHRVAPIVPGRADAWLAGYVDPLLATADGIARVHCRVSASEVCTGGSSSGVPSRLVEQALDVRSTISEFLHLWNPRRSAVAEARRLARRILENTAEIVEAVRRSVRFHIHMDVRDTFLDSLHQRYGVATHAAVAGYLGGLNWPLLLQHSDMGQQGLDVLEYTLQHNPPAVLSIRRHAETVLSPRRIGPPVDCEIEDEADVRALNMLTEICGHELAEEFIASGAITIESQGFSFEICGSDFVECTDPDGNYASLCVHTAGLTAHPTMEIGIAVLSIRHTLRDYLEKAVIHDCDEDFSIEAARNGLVEDG